MMTSNVMQENRKIKNFLIFLKKMSVCLLIVTLIAYYVISILFIIS
jgi:hypothetical protein